MKQYKVSHLKVLLDDYEDLDEILLQILIQNLDRFYPNILKIPKNIERQLDKCFEWFTNTRKDYLKQIKSLEEAYLFYNSFCRDKYSKHLYDLNYPTPAFVTKEILIPMHNLENFVYRQDTKYFSIIIKNRIYLCD